MIIVSILLALWGEAWWDDRADRIDEREMLTALHQELLGNRSTISEQLEEIQSTRAKHRALIAMTPAEIAAIPRDSLDQLIRMPMFRAYTVELADDELNAAVGSGRLSLIRNPEIRSGLGAYQARRADVAEVGVAIFDLTVEARLAFARRPDLTLWTVGSSGADAVTPESLEGIRRDADLMAIVAAKADLYNPFSNHNRQIRDAIDRLIVALEAELDLPYQANADSLLDVP